MRIIAVISGFLLSSLAVGQDNLTNIPDPDPAVELASFRVKAGFEVNLYASDPMIDPPIQMAWDERGRMWLATSTSYPQPLPGQKINDKIFVLEDTDHDGVADKSTVFADGLLTPTGILPGDGGVYIANSTEVLHLRDTDGDGRADERHVVLSGFGADDTHHLLHTFRWGPDGKMYMNQSVYTYSHVETPWGIERLRGGGIWRFDTESLELEVFARGLWNPWGYEVDRWGQSFATDGAGGQGIHFMFPDVAYTPAVGIERVLEGLNMGDPKYSGLALISGRHFPETMWGDLITHDYRANRVKHFVLEEDRSGFSATETEDLIWTDHYAFRPVDVSMGPDGALYVVDWYNPIIQHGEVDFRDPRRDHQRGRIWRVTAEGRPLVEAPWLAGASTQALLEALTLPEAWARRQAGRLLRERGAAAVQPVLDAWVQSLDDAATHAKLEALWTYQALGVHAPALLGGLLRDEDHRARAAALRVLYYWIDDVEEAEDLLSEAIDDPHPRVRREALHGLSRLEKAESARTALRVMDHPMDTFLEYALWNTMRALSPWWAPSFEADEGFLGEDMDQVVYALRVAADSTTVAALTRYYEAGSIPEPQVQEVLDVIGSRGAAGDLDALFDMALDGVQRGAVGREEHLAALLTAARDRQATPSAQLGRLADLIETGTVASRATALRLAGVWELVPLRPALVAVARDEQADETLRTAALEGLASLGGAESASMLEELTASLSPFSMRIEAARWLATMDMEAAGEPALLVLREAPPGADPWPLFQAFIQQENGRVVLAEALNATPIPAALAQVGLDRLDHRGIGTQALEEAFKASGAEEIPPKMDLNPSTFALHRLEHDARAQGDAERGREIYERPSLQCVVCHAIQGEGGAVGPDLSSIGVTAPADYLIESLLNPEASLKDGYALVRVVTEDGGVMVGQLAGESTHALQLKDASGGAHTIPLSQVRERAIVPGSLMPAGLMGQLDRDEFLDLLAYLSSLGKEPR